MKSRIIDLIKMLVVEQMRIYATLFIGTSVAVCFCKAMHIYGRDMVWMFGAVWLMRYFVILSIDKK